MILQERTGFHEREGFQGRGTVIHEREREKMGFHRRERNFTVKHSIITERNRISQERTGFYRRKRDFTGVNRI